MKVYVGSCILATILVVSLSIVVFNSSADADEKKVKTLKERVEFLETTNYKILNILESHRRNLKELRTLHRGLNDSCEKMAHMVVRDNKKHSAANIQQTLNLTRTMKEIQHLQTSVLFNTRAIKKIVESLPKKKKEK